MLATVILDLRGIRKLPTTGVPVDRQQRRGTKQNFSRAQISAARAPNGRPRPRAIRTYAASPVNNAVSIQVQGKHLEVTPAINEYANKKLSHVLDPFKSVVRGADVKLSARGGDSSKGERAQRMEVTIRTARHGVVRAEETKDDLYAAIDVACDKVSRSLRKLKEKSVKRGSWPGRGGSRGAETIRETLPADGDALASVDDGMVPSDDEVEAATSSLSVPDNVQRTKVFYLENMTLQDAVDQLQYVDHDFYVYLDDESGHVQVVYKRKNGNGYGVIITIPDEKDLVQ